VPTWHKWGRDWGQISTFNNCHKAKEKGQKSKTIEPRAKIKDELIEARKPLPQDYH